MTDEESLEAYEVFVQWERGEPQRHEETITASDAEMALHLAKRNVDVRNEPVEIWVTPRAEITSTTEEDTALTPSTDRGYRTVQWYAQNAIEE